ncbi:hypothetical protein GIL16c_gp07 [Bacillus phage GIL16c]|uniref:Uncharacterized protein n=1 Tax=Bacillus phage GIL16c TaxID=307240 RepID=Q5ILC5_9VIRU|nr:hypothetical protein GIL16c_gp07 [Bacillus phage GIL16c]AAW33571.1 hypothetical protein [Bacillus phage GIL16c]MEB9282792.1 hypothetical protein [Bacillus cereus]
MRDKLLDFIIELSQSSKQVVCHRQVNASNKRRLQGTRKENRKCGKGLAKLLVFFICPK